MARNEAYLEKLDLSEEQKPEVEKINKAYFDELSRLKNSGASRKEKYRTFKSLSSRRDEQMKAVLNQEQYQIYKQQQDVRRENFRKQRRNRK